MTHPPPEPPEGAFVIEASVLTNGDAAAVGAAVTVALCGNWEHDGPCRWPHHTEVVDADGGHVLVRTVAVAGDDATEVSRRIRSALAAGSIRGVEPGWTLLRLERVPFRADEMDLASRIARPSEVPPGQDS